MLAACIGPSPDVQWPLAFVKALEDHGSSESFPVLTLTLPSGDLSFSDTEAGAEDEQILRLISAWPRNLETGFRAIYGKLPLPEYVFEIQDPQGLVAAELRGVAARDVYRAPARLRWGLPINLVPSRMWPSSFTGIVVDWSTPTRDTVRIVVAHDHEWLRRPVLRHRVTRLDRPYAHESAIGRLYPVPFGRFDSRPTSGVTALPTLYTDTRTSEWLFTACLGHAYQVSRVWLNGTLAATSDYSIVQTTIKGLYTTSVKWLSDPGLDPIVVVDLVGLESVGDGTGVPLQTPAAMLRRALGEVAFSGYMGGAWSGAGDALFDLASFEEADDFAMANLYRPRGTLNEWTSERRVARYISTDILCLDLLSEACERFGWKPYWTEAGKIALGFLDHRVARVFLEGQHWIREEDDVGQSFRQVDLKARERDSLEAGVISVRDPSAGWNSAERQRDAWMDQEVSELDLVPFVTTDEPTAWTITGGEAPYPAMTEPHEAIADRPFAPDDARSRATWDAASATGTFRVRLRWADKPAMFSARKVVSVALHMRSRYVTNGGGTHTMKQGLRIGGTIYYGTDRTLTTTWTDYEDIWDANPATGNPWTIEDLAPKVLEASISATHVASQDKPEITQLFARVACIRGGAAGGLLRESLSRELLLATRQPQVTEIEVGLHRAAIKPGDMMSVSHTSAVAPGLAGWGTEIWQRHPHVALCRRFDLGARTVKWRLLDARDLIVPMWEVDQALSSAPEAAGVARMGGWQAGRAGQPDGRRFSRPTDPADGDPDGQATVTDPVGDTVTIAQDVEKYTPQGLHIQKLDTAPTPDLEGDELFYLHRHEGLAWPIDGWTAVFKIVNSFVAIQIYTIFRFGSDSVFLDVSAAEIRYRRTVAGFNYDAVVGGLVGPETLVIGIRCTSGQEQELTRIVDDETEGTTEESLPQYTLDVWLKRGSTAVVKGTSVTAVDGFPGTIYPGSDAGLEQLVGYFLSRRAWRSVLTDEEVEAEMEAVA